MSQVLIVGGGPGGSSAAWRLARAGENVTLLDAAQFPRVKLCAGWVTRAVWRHIEIEPADYPHTLQPFRRATLELDGARHETVWPETASYGIVRSEFDAHLLSRAVDAGADVHTGTRVNSIQREGSVFHVETNTGRSFEASFLIGAGGHQCPVARALGQVSGEEAVVVARESETELSADRLRELTPRHGTPELFAEPDFKGYGWYFTKGGFLNVGIGCVGTGKDLHRRCDHLLGRLRSDGRLPADLPLEPFRGHAYAVRMSAPRRISGPGFCLIGDAAGLAQSISGEGIGPAVESARFAADALLSTGLDRAPSAYGEAIAARFGPRETSGWTRLATRLPLWAAEGIARTVCRTPVLRRKLLFEGAFGMGGATIEQREPA